MTDTELETSAQLSAQRFLLEILYTNAFAGQPQAFTNLMAELQRLSRVAPTTAEPISNETQAELLLELQARTTAHLERFSNSVQGRIESGRSI